MSNGGEPGKWVEWKSLAVNRELRDVNETFFCYDESLKGVEAFKPLLKFHIFIKLFIIAWQINIPKIANLIE